MSDGGVRDMLQKQEITFITSRHEASVGHTLTWTMHLTASLQINVQIRVTFL